MREWKPRPDTGDLGRGFRQRRARHGAAAASAGRIRRSRLQTSGGLNAAVQSVLLLEANLLLPAPWPASTHTRVGSAVAPVADCWLAEQGHVQRERQNYAGANYDRAYDQPVGKRRHRISERDRGGPPKRRGKDGGSLAMGRHAGVGGD